MQLYLHVDCLNLENFSDWPGEAIVVSNFEHVIPVRFRPRITIFSAVILQSDANRNYPN
jgi:hypothetical protein